MRRRATATAAVVVLSLAGCRTLRPGERAPLEEPLRTWAAASPALRSFLERGEELNVQILVGWVAEDPSGRRWLRQAGFRADAAYFYPASAVKTFAAVAALERLGELRAATALPITRDTPLAYHPLFEGDQLRTSDASHLDGGTITVAHEIRKLAIVSDNDAFDRLYELVGPAELDASIRRAGLTSSRIVHRLGTARSADDNRRTPRVDVGGEAFTVTVPERTAPPIPPLPPIAGLAVGVARMSGDRRVEGPMDFSGKNRMALKDLQRGLCLLVRHAAGCGGRPFRLAAEDRSFLLRTMAELPSESMDPRFDLAQTPDTWGKFLLPGLERVRPRAQWRVVNKVGQAYGFSTDNAWVEHRSTGRSLFVAATLYTNANGVLNDGVYEYEAVADPFFAALGEAVGRALVDPPPPGA